MTAMAMAASAPHDPSFRQVIGDLTRETQPGHPSKRAIWWFHEVRNYLTDDLAPKGMRNPEHVPVMREILKDMVGRYPSLVGSVPEHDRRKFEECLIADTKASSAITDIARPTGGRPLDGAGVA